jgi:hypothetical protein
VIFDLKSGKRRRVVQIVFGFLAVIFFLGFVGFGIGGEVSGGIFDALGFGSGDSGSGSPQYEEQIEEAEATLETDPENEAALLDLARYHYLSATESGIESDPSTGVTSITEDARAELEEAVAAWERYLETKPKRPDAGVAANAAQAFVYLEDADGAASAQRIFAEDQRSSAAYYQLAFYLYADGKLSAGDEAGERAVELAEPSSRSAVRRSTEALAEQARKAQKRLEKDEKSGNAGGEGIEDPFGSLGAEGSSAPAP